MMIPEKDDLSCYLENHSYLQMQHPAIQAVCHRLFNHTDTEWSMIQKGFQFVLEEIEHSWDIQNHDITISATDVLALGHGICYAKSNLLAAILRCMGIPTGFCYQKLLLFNETDGRYCIHALNAVFLKSQNKWLRLDARGNKTGVQAACLPNQEKLAFVPQLDLGEIDYPIIYSEPNLLTMLALEQATDTLEMYLNDLPETLF
ncbi:MAG: transglutaminase family protein [Streptococcaceae bacterium]|jgi:hypothetical protein|nr:transglutaminase family protein [Streptococcaceae bacterium]